MSDGPIRLFPELYNISDFLNKDHPNHHPDTYKYIEYWEKQEKLCLEGKWGHDYDEERKLGGWRYMPGFLYFYINMWTILQTERKQRVRISPNLRDVEWILSYAWLKSRGFSGFEDDTEYSSHEALLSDMTDEEIYINFIKDPNPEAEEMNRKNIYHEGKRKKYIDCFEYLKRTHEKPLGRPVYGNTARNLMILGSRNFGKSFFTSGAVIGHEFFFDGHKYYDYNYLNKPNEISIFVGAFASDKSSELLTMFKNGAANMPGSWGSGDDYRPSYFYKNTTGTLNPNNKQQAYRHTYKAKEGGIWKEKGSKSAIYHGVYTVDNPQVAVGSRYTVMIMEEIGLFRNFLAALGSNELCIADGVDRFGSTIAIGTGGNMETITEARIVFYDPDTYGFVGFSNNFEPGEKKTGLFIPAYYALNKFKDEKGNTNIKAAYDSLQKVREKKRKASTSMAINDELMSRPMVPSEMFLSNTFSNFPIADLRERLSQLESTDEFSDTADIGELAFVDRERKEVKWYRDSGRLLTPILSTSMDQYRGDYSGAMIIYEHPVDKLPDSTFTRSLYKVVYDPVKDDKFGTSLGSILVYKGFQTEGSWEGTLQDNIVAECIMRTDNTEDIHDAAIKLALYYNAKILVENDIPDFIRYCKRIGLYYILQPTPTEAITRVLKSSNQKYEVGVRMVPGLGVQCEQLIANWLNLPYKEEMGRLYNNCFKLKSKRLIEELINYKREGNFDHVSSLKILMLWLSQEIDITPEEKERRKDIYLNLKKKLHSARRDQRMNHVKQIFYSY